MDFRPGDFVRCAYHHFTCGLVVRRVQIAPNHRPDWLGIEIQLANGETTIVHPDDLELINRDGFPVDAQKREANGG